MHGKEQSHLKMARLTESRHQALKALLRHTERRDRALLLLAERSVTAQLFFLVQS